MAQSTTWFKPYILNPHNIERVVNSEGPGVYVLGNIDAQKKFRIQHIKSSGNVKDELRKYLGKFHVFMYKPLKHQLHAYQAGQQKLEFAR